MSPRADSFISQCPCAYQCSLDCEMRKTEVVATVPVRSAQFTLHKLSGENMKNIENLSQILKY